MSNYVRLDGCVCPMEWDANLFNAFPLSDEAIAHFGKTLWRGT